VPIRGSRILASFFVSMRTAGQESGRNTRTKALFVFDFLKKCLAAGAPDQTRRKPRKPQFFEKISEVT
jgi:hypothetical protein